MRVRVKICGIARAADAESAVEAGADALGFVLWEGSPRFVSAEWVGAVSRDLPPYVSRVGVFVNEPRESLLSKMREARLLTAQLHGDESPDYCRDLGVDWYRTFHLEQESDAASVCERIAAFDARVFMLDTRAGSMPGGTGRTFDWKAAAKVSLRSAGISGGAARRLILAGGLSPENVAEAIRRVRPWAVDVSTGVESAPAKKDPVRVREFMAAVRSVA